MKKYSVFAKDYQHEEGVLVFANTAKEAIKLGYPWLEMTESYIDTRARLIKGFDHLDKEKREDIPHCVSDPTACEDCNQWGSEIIDGLCDSCGGR